MGGIRCPKHLNEIDHRRPQGRVHRENGRVGHFGTDVDQAPQRFLRTSSIFAAVRKKMQYYCRGF